MLVLPPLLVGEVAERSEVGGVFCGVLETAEPYNVILKSKATKNLKLLSII